MSTRDDSTSQGAIGDAVLRDLIRQAIQEVLAEPAPARSSANWREQQALMERRHGQPPRPRPRRPEAVEAIRRATPARIVQGRTGTRYLTDVYLGLRADHAIALDAVESSLEEEFAKQNGLFWVQSRCKDHQQFLLYPDEGRRLSDESRQALSSSGDEGADITIIAGDGLSAMALMENGPALIKELVAQLRGAGFRVSQPLGAKFARVGLQDDIGVLLKSKATLIIVGERPGLGTGDSLSIYTAYGPKLNQDNSEKDCISNIRDLGLSAAEAARRCTDLFKRTFAAGGGGVKLVAAN